MNKKRAKKIQISRAAATLYLKNPRFTMGALAEASGTEPETIHDYFPNRREALRYFYEGLMEEYRESVQSIETYSSYSLSEKLSNLALTLIDLMEPHKEFVRQTYREQVQCAYGNNGFKHLFIDELKAIYQSDPDQSRLSTALNNKLVYRAGFTHFHLLIHFWLKDQSAGSQKTLELVDKWTSFVQELHYSSILDRGFDVAKFFFYNSPFSNTRS